MLMSQKALRHTVVIPFPDPEKIWDKRRGACMQGPKPLTPEQLRSVRQPIEVAIMTGHYFGNDYGREITGCSLGSTPLNCTFIPDRSKVYQGNINQDAREADAVWWHAPNTCMLPVGIHVLFEDSLAHSGMSLTHPQVVTRCSTFMVLS